MIILTDLSEVLIRGFYGIETLVEESYGEEIAERFAERRRRCNPYFVELMRGHLTENQYWEIFLRDYDWPFGAAEAKLILTFNLALGYSRSAMSVYKRIIEYPETTLSDSKRISGRPEFWIISDHIAERKDEIESMHSDIFKFATKTIWSFDCGIVKSDNGFFHQLLYKYGLDRGELILVDDLVNNIWSASSTGIAGILYHRPKQLEEEMRSLGFRFGSI